MEFLLNIGLNIVVSVSGILGLSTATFLETANQETVSVLHVFLDIVSGAIQDLLKLVETFFANLLSKAAK